MMYQFMNIERRGRAIEMPMSNGRKVELYTYRLVERGAPANARGRRSRRCTTSA